MLIRSGVLERIRAGEVHLAFRRWRRPSVREGGTLRTSAGVLRVGKVEPVAPEEISESDARRAGYPSREALFREQRRREGQWYRVYLAFGGEDPRIELRADAALSEEELAGIRTRLRGLDSRSRYGEWTLAVLAAIHRCPNMPAGGLARETGFERDWLKLQVRKLKELGLTISHHPGYTLSPRGAAVLDFLRTAA